MDLNCQSLTAPTTYFISDERMLLHAHEWDADYIEKPLRLKSILHAVAEEGLLANCILLESRKASEEELQLVHTKRLVEEIKATKDADEVQLAHFTQYQEHVYANNHTWDACLLAAGCALKATETVLRNPGTNAFAAIRPPGHHASSDKASGFCFFNNVAVCAKKAVEELGVKRVLVIDWDVHFGNGTQEVIADRPDAIRLISIHQHQHGTFYPKVAAGGIGHEYPNTVNVPLNKVGYGDVEYAAFVQLIVRPMVEEWRPELILVSCGFDAAIGDPLGGMKVSPLGYGYMAGALAAMGVPMVVLLEGGYFIDSIANGAVFVLRALIEKAPPVNVVWSSAQPSFLHALYSSMAHYSSLCRAYTKWLETVNTIRERHGLERIGEAAYEEHYEPPVAEEYPLPLVGFYSTRPAAVTEYYSAQVDAIVRDWKANSGPEGKKEQPSVAAVETMATILGERPEIDGVYHSLRDLILF